eukprot:3249322-Pyramimonas_sp.AAC.1
MLQLVLLSPLDAVQAAFPHMHLGNVVDDFGLQRLGREEDVAAELAGATRLLHSQLNNVSLPIALKKSR